MWGAPTRMRGIHETGCAAGDKIMDSHGDAEHPEHNAEGAGCDEEGEAEGRSGRLTPLNRRAASRRLQLVFRPGVPPFFFSLGGRLQAG